MLLSLPCSSMYLNCGCAENECETLAGAAMQCSWAILCSSATQPAALLLALRPAGSAAGVEGLHDQTLLCVTTASQQAPGAEGRACAAQANVIASILKGYKPNLSPLKEQPMFPPGAFSKAPKPTGTFIPKNDPLLSKQPHGTVPFFKKPDLSLDYPLVSG